jgi:hypothetical protein
MYKGSRRGGGVNGILKTSKWVVRVLQTSWTYKKLDVEGPMIALDRGMRDAFLSNNTVR